MDGDLLVRHVVLSLGLLAYSDFAGAVTSANIVPSPSSTKTTALSSTAASAPTAAGQVTKTTQAPAVPAASSSLPPAPVPVPAATLAPATPPTPAPVTSGNQTGGSDSIYSPGQFKQSVFDKFFNNTDHVDWLTQTYFGYTVQQHYAAVADLAMTQPVYQTDFKTVLFQGRVGYLNGSADGNLGLGFRSLSDNRNYIWGLNAFFDESIHYSQERYGVGGEFFTRYLTFRANAYRAYSPNRNVGTSQNAVTTYERALKGFDASVETPVPKISWMRFVIGGYRWIGDRSGGMNGGEAHLRVYPARQVEMDLGLSNDNANGALAFLQIYYYFGANTSIQNSATTPSYTGGTFAPMDLSKQMLQKVVRFNNIVVEKTYNPTSAGKMTVTIGT